MAMLKIPVLHVCLFLWLQAFSFSFDGLFVLVQWSCSGYRLIWGAAGLGFSYKEQVDIPRGFSPSCCSATPSQLALASSDACTVGSNLWILLSGVFFHFIVQ